ncbi:hypothetical protein MGSAQ_003350, partial [marine sediment metagenome]
NRSTVCIVGANTVTFVSAKALKTSPDVGLNVF